MADLDDDGFLDMVTGCFEGGSYWLKGLGDDYEAPRPVLDADGDVLRLGQYWDYDDKRSPEGDGLGPLHNAKSCLECHF